MQGRAATNRRHWPTHLAVPWLIGLALSLFGAATIDRFEDLFHPCSSLTYVALLAMLCALAVGTWLPNRFARQFSRLTLRYRYRSLSRGFQPARIRLRRTQAEVEDAPRRACGSGDDVITDAQLRVIGAACLVLGGLAIMLVGPWAGKLGLIYYQALDTFYWTRPTLHALDFGLIAAYVAVPLSLLGIAFNCTQRVALLHTRRLLTALTSLSVGVSLGLAMWSLSGGLPAAMTTLISALLLLATGLAQLQPGDPANIVSSETTDLPKISDRWRFVLIWMLIAAGLLITSYILSWQKFLVLDAGWPVARLPVLGVTVGLIISNFAFSQSLRSLHSIAILCMFVSLSVAAALVFAGGSGLGTASANDTFSFSPVGWSVVISTPPVLMGLALGSATTAAVQRSPRPATAVLSSSLSICFGAGLACVIVIVKLLEAFTFFDVLVMFVLLWLAMGGLLLIYDPHFGLRTRWPHAAFMVATLLLLTVILPQQAVRWSAILQKASAASVGWLQTVGNYYEAQQQLSAIRRQPGTTAATHVDMQPWGRGGQLLALVGPLSMDDMLGELRISRGRNAAVIITLPAAPSPYFSDKLQASLVQAAAQKLRADGVFAIRFKGLPNNPPQLQRWRQQVQNTFEHTEIIATAIQQDVTLGYEWCLLACHEPLSQAARANSTAQKTPRMSRSEP